jgi:hypothetical protein
MTSVLLRMRGLDAFDADAEATRPTAFIGYHGNSNSLKLKLAVVSYERWISTNM